MSQHHATEEEETDPAEVEHALSEDCWCRPVTINGVCVHRPNVEQRDDPGEA